MSVVLAFDTSGPHCDVAILRDGEVLAHRHEAMKKGQAERLMPLIQETLTEAGVTMADLSVIGVGTGPGNFTGTRIAVAAARGLALGLGIPAEGVGAVEAYGDCRDVIVCLPAPRDQVHLGRGDDLVTISAQGPLPDGWTQPLTGPAAAPLAQATGADLVPTPPLSVAIAGLAGARAATGRARPAPIYIRPADAAPASDRPPPIL